MSVKVVLINDTSIQNHYGCKLVVNNIHSCAAKAGMDIFSSVPVNVSWREENYLQAIAECDVVIVNGEGTLHSSKRSAIELSEVAPYCRKIAKPCFLINSVYQNNSDELANNLKSFTAVYVRESFSKKELEKQGVISKVVPDMIFYRNIFESFEVNPSGSNILFSGSMYKDVSNALYAASRKHGGTKFVTLWQRPVKISEFCLNKGKKRKFFDKAKKLLPFRYWVKVNRLLGVLDLEYDFDVNQCSTDGLDELVGLFNSAEFIYTGYFHFTCMAMMARKPFRYISSNTHKIEGMLYDAGLKNKFLGLENFSLKCFSHFTSNELISLKMYLDSMPGKADEMMKFICESKA